MTRFLHWRKMTWALALWNAGAIAWLLITVFDLVGGASNCATDSAGVALSAITKRDCVDAAASGSGVEVVIGSIFWFLGVALLGGLWFLTRPLWRQGHGARLRRLREVPGPVRPRP